MTSLPFTETEILTAWALRFDGYRYMSETGFAPPSDYVARFGTPAWAFEPLEELAIFFVHQRQVAKWGASRPNGSSDWQFLREIFLQVVDHEIPERWRVASYYDKWANVHAPLLELERAAILHQLKAFRV